MDPAGGLAQPLARFFRLALQQMHFAGGGFGARTFGCQPPRCFGRIAHPPFAPPKREVFGRAVALMHQILGNIEADATGPHNGHAPAHWRAAQHVAISQNMARSLPFGLTGDGGVAGGDAGGDDDLVVAGQHRGHRGGVQPQIDTGRRQGPGEPVDQTVKFFLARNLTGQIQLAADRAGLFVQCHHMAAPRRHHRAHHPARARTDDGDAAGGIGRCVGQLNLVAGAGIDQARGQLAAEGMVKAGLVAGDAGGDVARAPYAGLGHEIGVGKERTGHRNHVRLATRQNTFGHLWRVDAVGGDDGDGDFGPKARGKPGKGGAGHAGGNGGHPRLVPADAGVQDRGTRPFDGPGQFNDFRPGRPIGDQVDQADTVDQDEIGAGCSAHPTDGFHRQAHAVCVCATPVISPAIGVADQELVQEVPLGPHHLDPVIPCLLRAGGGSGDVADLFLDPLFVQRAGGKGTDG